MSVPDTVDKGAGEDSRKNRYLNLLRDMYTGITSINGVVLFCAAFQRCVWPVIAYVMQSVHNKEDPKRYPLKDFFSSSDPSSNTTASNKLSNNFLGYSAALFGIEVLGGWLWSKPGRGKGDGQDSEAPLPDQAAQRPGIRQKIDEGFGVVIGITTAALLSWAGWLASINREAGEKFMGTKSDQKIRRWAVTWGLAGLLGAEAVGYVVSRIGVSKKEDETEKGNVPESRFMQTVAGTFAAFTAAATAALLGVSAWRISSREKGQTLITAPVKFCAGLAASGAAGYLAFDLISHQKHAKPAGSFAERVDQGKENRSEAVHNL